jgi:TP53 regulating kinase-like protein
LLDAQLTRSRISQEARCLVRCAKNGVNVPGVRCVDLEAGILGIEWIEGRSVRELLGAGDEDDEDDEIGVDEVARALESFGLSEGPLPCRYRLLSPC